MADVPPRSQGVLRNERLHEIGRHDGAWTEDLRGEPAPRGDVRLEERAEHRVFPSGAARQRPAGRGVREWRHRPIRESTSGAAGKGYLVDGRGRDHRVVSRRAGDRRVRRQCGAGVHRGWHSAHRAATPTRAAGPAVRRALRGWTGSIAVPRSERRLITLHRKRFLDSPNHSRTIMTTTKTRPRLTSLAPQFLVDDLARSIAYYQKLGFTFGEPWDGFYAIGLLDGLELHLKEAPQNADERRFRRANEHLDAAAGVDGIEAFHAQCVANG